MGDEFEKTTKTILGNDESSYSKVVVNLAIGIDRELSEMKSSAEERHKKMKEDAEKKHQEMKADAEKKHREMMTAISVMKSAVDNDCFLCREGVKKNFNLLKPILSLADNPKLVKVILFLIGLVLIMAFRGGHDYVTDISKIVTAIK